jgi:hypothetical protein
MDNTLKELFDPQDLKKLDRLKEELDQKPALGFCGAGMSIPVGYPSWKQLMEQFLIHLEENSIVPVPDDLKIAVKTSNVNFPELAEQLKKSMDEKQYFDFIKKTFERFTDRDFSYEYELLAKLRIRLWITTNYEWCIVDALQNELGKQIEISESIPFDKLLNDECLLPEVVYLHGHVKNPNSLVFTSSDYQEVYYKNQNIPFQLKNLAAFPVLFLGYSLSDEEINTQLKSIIGILSQSAASKYAILPRTIESNLYNVNAFAMKLANMGITPIFYKQRHNNDHYGRTIALQMLLNNIIDEKNDGDIQIGWEKTLGKTTLTKFLNNIKRDFSTALRMKKCSFQRKGATISINKLSQKEMIVSAITKSGQFKIISSDLSLESNIEENISLPSLSQNIEIKSEPLNFFIKRELIESNSKLNKNDFEETISDPNFNQSVEIDSTLKYKAIVHASALGKGRTISKITSSIRNPLSQSDLLYSISDLFHPYISWRMDSPILNCYIYYKNNDNNSFENPVEITIIGQGISWIRKQIENLSYFTSLILSESENTFLITNNIIHISTLKYTPQIKSKSLNLIQKILSSVSKNDEIDFLQEFITSNLNPMSGIVSIIKKLSKSTGLIKVFESGFNNLSDFKKKIRRYVSKMPFEKHPLLIKPKAGNPIVSCIEIPDFPFLQKGKLKLSLSLDILNSEIFKELLNSYYMDLIVNISADFERRKEFYRNEIDSCKNQYLWFKNLTEAEQNKIPDVKANIKLDKDLGINIQVSETVVNAKTFYLNNIPNFLIPEREKELERLKEESKPLEKLFEDDNFDFKQLCISRLFDCVFKGVKPSENKKVSYLFQSWYDIVNPMLKLEVTNLFQRKGIEGNCNYNNMNISIGIDTNNNELQIFFYSIIDSQRNTIVIDQDRKSLIIHDILDNAGSCKLEECETENSHLDHLMIKSDNEDLLEKIKLAFYNNPFLVNNICNYIYSVVPKVFNYSVIKNSVVPNIVSTTASKRFLTLFLQNCRYSAEEALKPEDEFDVPPGKAIMLAFINCLRRDYSPIETMKELRNNPSYANQIPPSISTRFNQALSKNRDMVDSFLELSSMPQDKIELNQAEKAVWKIEACIEGIKIFTQLSQGINKINSEGDTLDRIFFYISDAFEAIYNSFYYPSAPSMDRIQSILLGKPVKE